MDFLGPHLSPLVIAGLAIVPTLLNALGAGAIDSLHTLKNLVSSAADPSKLASASIVILGWYLFHAVLYYLVPCHWISGTRIRDGTILHYPINAIASLVAAYASLLAIGSMFGPVPFLWIADNVLSLCIASTLLSIFQSTVLYAASFRTTTLLTDDKARKDGIAHQERVPVLLAEGGNSGYFFYDFFIGRELNPRIGSFDLKFFCELRPGLIGWTVLNAAYAVKQGVLVSGMDAEWMDILHGVSNSMWLVLAFQFYYVFDALWNEAAILTTLDITTDGFGFMLNFGDLVWVPFTYSLQSRYLATNPLHLHPLAVGLLILLKLAGLYIFRGSNGQKNNFRTNPDSPAVAHLKFMKTASGSKLLISGWWGVARHINYTGDWIMALAWCLPTGFGTPLTYFYAFYFGILLWHREMRDEHKCKGKYGKDWDQYCKVVPYRFIPYVY
ncbi:ergosterol biosynthesis ERG4/ERG24 [Chytriomyces sp. MP71]|nr:ergosterol biosynthesis ERG4/ERG24 [Chytriomyces sp. MP71]